MNPTPSGYTYDQQLPASPVTEDQLSQLLRDVMWSGNDAAALRRAGEILGPRVGEIMDVWYGFIGSTPHLRATGRRLPGGGAGRFRTVGHRSVHP